MAALAASAAAYLAFLGVEDAMSNIVHEIAAAVAAQHMIGAGMTPDEIRQQFDDAVAEYGEAGSPTAFATARAALAAISAAGCRVVKDDLLGEEIGKTIETANKMAALAIATARQEALEEAAKVAKAGWLTSRRDVIGDADRECELCEEIDAAIRALIECLECPRHPHQRD